MVHTAQPPTRKRNLEMKLSIAMCTYNGAKHVLEQLESFAKQKRPPDELVVCDDCSADETVSIVQEFSKSSPFKVTLIENPRNLGFVKNFEQCIRACTGDYIFLSDQDDVWSADKLQLFSECMQRNPLAGSFFCDADLVDHALRPLGKRWWQLQKFGKRDQAKLESAQGAEFFIKNPASMIAGATMAIKSSYLPIVFPIAPGWNHDAWISTVLAILSPVRLVQPPLNLYRQHATQTYGAPVDSARVHAMARDRGSSTAHFDSTVGRYSDLRSRVSSVGVNQSHLRFIDRKLKHWTERGNVRRTSRLRGLSIVLTELIAGNYHALSQGWRSAALDTLYIFRTR
jgi:glycosyltransferase involved in cell wall biosynthesis